MKQQDAAATRAYMENDVLQQQMDIIGATDPTAQADAYKKIFGDCCENPQVINQ